MRRIYFIGLILYTLIVLHVAFPNIFSFEDLETVHVAIFIFALFVVDCFISIWISKRKDIQGEKEMERKKRKHSFWMMTYCLSLVLTVAFSEHIPLERLNIDLVRSYLHTIFYALSSLYERKARRRGKSACRRSEQARA